jgi:uncharacterized protein DUF6325
MSVEAPEIGPLDYLLIEFPGTQLTGEGLPLLADLVDRGIIRILDLVFVEKALDGTTTVLALDDLIAGGTMDLAIFEGVSSRMVGSEDIASAGSVLEPGSSAGLLIYENSWAAPFATAMRRAGGQVVASGRIPVQDVIDALDATESDVSVSNAR